MFITVAICTWNRAESLRRTLHSLAAMRVPDDIDWEVVVVNNNCTDHTDAVIAAFAGRLPIRREFEPQSGLSRARNCAVDAARGDYIVWTDDDVVVDPGWIAGYAEAFRRWPEATVFGGRITPRYEEPVVSWVKEREALLAGLLVIRNFGEAPVPLSMAEDRVPYGANFAVRAIEQRTFRYNPELGLNGAGRRLGEEVDVIRQLLCSGASGYWLPAARVEHCIGRGRQTRRYLADYYSGAGESVASQNGKEGGPFWFGAPRWLWRRLVEEWLCYRIHRVISPAPVWVRCLRNYAFARGTIRYWRNERA